MLGTERNAVHGLHLTIRREFFHQFLFLRTDSTKLEDKVLPSDMLALY